MIFGTKRQSLNLRTLSRNKERIERPFYITIMIRRFVNIVEILHEYLQFLATHCIESGCNWRYSHNLFTVLSVNGSPCGWVQKMASGWESQKKSIKCAYVIYEWPLPNPPMAEWWPKEPLSNGTSWRLRPLASEAAQWCTIMCSVNRYDYSRTHINFKNSNTVKFGDKELFGKEQIGV